MSQHATHPHSAFENLYPDVDPGTSIPTHAGERLSLTVSAAVLAYGGATGNLIITGAGLALILFALIASANNTSRRIRREARTRFPDRDWAEISLLRSTRTTVYVPLFWLFIAACSLGLFHFVPATHLMWAGIAAAAITAALTWFMPGLSPVWLRPRARSAGRDHVPTDDTSTPAAISTTPTDDTSLLQLDGLRS